MSICPTACEIKIQAAFPSHPATVTLFWGLLGSTREAGPSMTAPASKFGHRLWSRTPHSGHRGLPQPTQLPRR